MSDNPNRKVGHFKTSQSMAVRNRILSSVGTSFEKTIASQPFKKYILYIVVWMRVRMRCIHHDVIVMWPTASVASLAFTAFIVSPIMQHISLIMSSHTSKLCSCALCQRWRWRERMTTRTFSSTWRAACSSSSPWSSLSSAVCGWTRRRLSPRRQFKNCPNSPSRDR